MDGSIDCGWMIWMDIWMDSQIEQWLSLPCFHFRNHSYPSISRVFHNLLYVRLRVYLTLIIPQVWVTERKRNSELAFLASFKCTTLHYFTLASFKCTTLHYFTLTSFKSRTKPLILGLSLLLLVKRSNQNQL